MASQFDLAAISMTSDVLAVFGETGYGNGGYSGPLVVDDLQRLDFRGEVVLDGYKIAFDPADFPLAEHGYVVTDADGQNWELDVRIPEESDEYLATWRAVKT